MVGPGVDESVGVAAAIAAVVEGFVGVAGDACVTQPAVRVEIRSAAASVRNRGARQVTPIPERSLG
jgi:hypothetical protein